METNTSKGDCDLHFKRQKQIIVPCSGNITKSVETCQKFSDDKKSLKSMSFDPKLTSQSWYFSKLQWNVIIQLNLQWHCQVDYFSAFRLQKLEAYKNKGSLSQIGVKMEDC